MKHTPEVDLIPRRLAIRVRGVVQGVGFRPFVYNTARGLGLSGFVLNAADTVEIEAQGPAEAVERFVAALRHAAPRQSRVDSVETEAKPCLDELPGTFEIRQSAGLARPQPTIPADLATCDECLAEIRSPRERRYQYPFTNCTNCGPRWSIIEELPYDRPRTSMAGFTMCPQCRTEYDNPADRRFHAQPIACPQCGPELELIDAHGRELALPDRALDHAAEAVLGGKVVAMKGLGGFQLLVDATDEAAVARLRERKQRPDRPFALMIATLHQIRAHCQVSDEEAAALTSPAAPILLLRRRKYHAAGGIAPSVAPGNPYLGVMLPYTPLHHVLMARIGRPIVCTSGNLAEEPMATTTEDALKRLGAIADIFLVHDRPIVRPVDDSVARVGPEGLEVFRRARGFAPLSIDLGIDAPTILAVGGHLKNVVALCLGRKLGERQSRGSGPFFGPCGVQSRDTTSENTDPTPSHLDVAVSPGAKVVLSAHIGDLESVASVEVFRRAVSDLVGFFHVVPDVVACDLHPDYASTRLAEQLAHAWKRPLVRVQHHHAHAAACIAEHRLDGPVLGLCWDGTGYGADGTIWGGEALLCNGGDFVRAAHLRTFGLPGGERAVREPRRSALGLLFEILGEDALRYAAEWFRPEELHTLGAMLSRQAQTPRTSSMGRLFDGVSALCGLCARSTFEGQGAMALEYASYPFEEGAYPLPLSDAMVGVADWEPTVRAVLEDVQRGEAVGRIGARFHNALAELAVAIAQAAGCRQVVLSGGCFQNALLAKRVRLRLAAGGFKVKTHHLVPPGDGGIALGQAYVAAKRFSHSNR